MGTTQNWQLSYPEPGATPNVPRDIQELARDTALALDTVNAAAVKAQTDANGYSARLTALEASVKSLQQQFGGLIIPDYTSQVNAIQSEVSAVKADVAGLGMPAPVGVHLGTAEKIVTATSSTAGLVPGYDLAMRNPHSKNHLLVRWDAFAWAKIPRGEGTVVLYMQPIIKSGSGPQWAMQDRIEGGMYGASGNGRTLRYDAIHGTLDVVIAPGQSVTCGMYCWMYKAATVTNATPSLTYAKMRATPIAWEMTAPRNFIQEPDEVVVEP